MISLSCAESSSSICAMRALIIASVSAAMVTVPLSTSLTKLRTRSLPRSRAAGSRPRRPCSTMRSRSPSSADSVTPPCDWDWVSLSDIGRSRGDLRPQLSHGVCIVDCLLQDLFELVVPLQATAEVGELRAQLEQLTQWLHLLSHLVRREVLEALELQLDGDLRPVRVELVLGRELQPRLGALEDGIEVVRVHLDELALLEAGQRLRRVTAQIGQDAHEEGELLHLDRAARFHLVGDTHARRPDALELLLGSLCHHPLRIVGRGAARRWLKAGHAENRTNEVVASR